MGASARVVLSAAVRVRVPWLFRGLSSLVLLGILGGTTGRARAAETVVLVLRSHSFAAEEARLIEALRIYTRDLDCRVLVAGDAPSSTSSTPDVGEFVLRQLRSDGADVAVWVERRGDGRLVYAVLATTQPEPRETEIAPGGAVAAAEAVALKIRTLLSRRAVSAPAAESQDRSREAAPEAAPAGKVTAPPPRPVPEALVAKPAASVPQPPRLPEPSVPPAQPAPPMVRPGAAPWDEATVSRLAIGAAYGVVLPRDVDWVRHGPMLSAELRLGRRPLFVLADVSLTFRAESATSSYTVSLDDLPIGLGLLHRWTSGRWHLAAGPRASLHVFHVSGVELTDGRVGSVRRLSAGLGGMARLEFSLRDTLAVYGGASLEALVPPRNFTLSQSPVLTTGPGLAGVSFGLLLAVP